MRSNRKEEGYRTYADRPALMLPCPPLFVPLIRLERGGAMKGFVNMKQKHEVSTVMPYTVIKRDPQTPSQGEQVGGVFVF